MDKFKAILDGENEILVDGLFYLYNSKYYLIYTKKELDENGYVVLYLVQVGKEIKKSDSGTVDTGYMVGVEVQDIEDWKNVQKSITTIVNDKKAGKESPEIKYLPMNMIKKIKILGSKKFRLVKDVLEQHFGLIFDNEKPQEIEKAKEIVKDTVVENIETENVKADSASPEEVSNKESSDTQLNIFNPINIDNNVPEAPVVNEEPKVEEIPAKPIEEVTEPKEEVKEEEALVFKPNVETIEEPVEEVKNDTVVEEVPLVSINEEPTPVEVSDVQEVPVELFKESEEQVLNYEALYNEVKDENENLKQKVKDLESKIDDIKKILG